MAVGRAVVMTSGMLPGGIMQSLAFELLAAWVGTRHGWPAQAGWPV